MTDEEDGSGDLLYRVTCPPCPASVKTVGAWLIWRAEADAQMLAESQEKLYVALVARFGRDNVNRAAVYAHCVEEAAEAKRLINGTMH
ncbi:MAG: hypothetical protein H0V16_10150 [Burkholderiaceae bacterium]|nr:hypothetical protein [Burkholderiaceae bacterium]